MNTLPIRLDTVPAPSRHRARRGSETRVRDPQVGVRLSPPEFERVSSLAAAARLSRPDYMRRAALGGRARTRRAAVSADQAVADALRQVAGQLARIGNNVNQIARSANLDARAGRSASPDATALGDVEAALDAIRAEVRRALGLRSVLDDDGDAP